MAELIEDRDNLKRRGATDKQMAKLALLDASLVYAPDWREDRPWFIRICNSSMNWWWNADKSLFYHFSSAEEAMQAYITYLGSNR